MMPQIKQTAAQFLAEYCVDLQLSDLPEEALTHAKHLLLDLLGVALAGSDTPEAEAAKKAVVRLSPGGGPCTLWGTGITATPAFAALYNGIIAHARELDDFGGVDHSGAVVIPAILAVAEAFPVVSGEKLLLAMIAGYEVGRRVLDSAGGYRAHNHGDGFHSTGTCGSFAAAAAVTKAMGQKVEETVWALGLAGTFTGGTWSFNTDSAMSKRFNVGRAAETGITAALLASSGFTGSTHVFEAPWGGFLGTYAKAEPKPEMLTCDRLAGYGILRSGVKPYAACRDNHSSIDVILLLRQRYDLKPADIAAIEVRCIPEMMQMIGKSEFPGNRIEAQLHLPYSIAVALKTGRAFLDEYEMPFLADPEIEKLATKIKLIESPELPFDSEPYLTVITKDGRRLQGHVDFASGAKESPLPQEAILAKFDALARRVLAGDKADALKNLILAVDRLRDVRDIIAGLKLQTKITKQG